MLSVLQNNNLLSAPLSPTLINIANDVFPATSHFSQDSILRLFRKQDLVTIMNRSRKYQKKNVYFFFSTILSDTSNNSGKNKHFQWTCIDGAQLPIVITSQPVLLLQLEQPLSVQDQFQKNVVFNIHLATKTWEERIQVEKY